MEDPDLVMGPIKGVKPKANMMFNKISGFWVICAEDTSADKLTYLKIIDSEGINEKTSLQVRESKINEQEKLGLFAPPLSADGDLQVGDVGPEL